MARVSGVAGCCGSAGKVKIRFYVVPAETVQVDSRILFIFMLSDAVVGTKGLCSLIAYPSLKALEKSSTARQTRAKLLSFRGMILCWGVSVEDRKVGWFGESDCGGVRV